jgi:hypothetical protein
MEASKVWMEPWAAPEKFNIQRALNLAALAMRGEVAWRGNLQYLII